MFTETIQTMSFYVKQIDNPENLVLRSSLLSLTLPRSICLLGQEEAEVAVGAVYYCRGGNPALPSAIVLSPAMPDHVCGIHSSPLCFPFESVEGRKSGPANSCTFWSLCLRLWVCDSCATLSFFPFFSTKSKWAWNERNSHKRKGSEFWNRTSRYSGRRFPAKSTDSMRNQNRLCSISKRCKNNNQHKKKEIMQM